MVRGMDEAPWYETVVMPALLRHARTGYGASMRAALAAAGCDDIPPNGMYLIGGMANNDANGDALPLGQLIRELRLSKQSAGVLVDSLVARGYIERRTDAEDRRRVTIALTARGREAAAIQASARAAVDAELLAHVGQDALRQTRRTLAVLCDIGRQRLERD